MIRPFLTPTIRHSRWMIEEFWCLAYIAQLSTYIVCHHRKKRILNQRNITPQQIDAATLFDSPFKEEMTLIENVVY